MLFRAALLASAVAFAAPALAQPKTTLNVGMAAQDIGQLDPHFAVSTIDRVAGRLDVQRPGAVPARQHRPGQARARPRRELGKLAEDGKTWTFHLRHGVQFHGGFGELTADDVVFSLKKAGDAKTSAFSSELRPFQTIEAVDPYTVRLVLKDNVPSVLGILTNYAQGFIVSKKAVEQRGDDFKRNPIGTGPFAFASVTPNQSLELVAQRGVFPRRAEDQEDQLPLHPVRRVARPRVPERRARRELRPRRPGLGRTAPRRMPHTIVDVFEPAELARAASQHHGEAARRHPRAPGDRLCDQPAGDGALARRRCQPRGAERGPARLSRLHRRQRPARRTTSRRPRRC